MCLLGLGTVIRVLETESGINCLESSTERLKYCEILRPLSTKSNLIDGNGTFGTFYLPGSFET